MQITDKEILETFEIEDNKVVGKNIKISNLDQIVDHELYIREMKEYDTEDIEGSGSTFTAHVKRIEDYNIIIDFLYIVHHFAVNGKDLGTKTDKGELSINIFTSESSITVDSTKIVEPHRI